jgi:glycogen(starch) synthase
MKEVPKRKLVILSYAFAPSIGGIETVSRVLARTFARRGYEVVVVTQTPGTGPEPEEPYRVVRRPNAGALATEIRKADVVLQSNISLRLAWPLWALFPRKAYVLVHHGVIARSEGGLAWRDRVKRAMLRRAYCLSVSEFLASTIEAPSKVVRNPYANTVFRINPEIERSRDILFVGRLVPTKGVDVILRAFRTILERRPAATLSIIGLGPEEGALRELAASLGINRSVSFLGARRGDELAEVMNRHKIVVVPSRSWQPEACPVVPVEAIACGCVPVGSRVGGVPESIGDAGPLFDDGNFEELASICLRLLNSPALIDQYRAAGEQHLKQFDPEAVADAYESHFAGASRH